MQHKPPSVPGPAPAAGDPRHTLLSRSHRRRLRHVRPRILYGTTHFFKVRSPVIIARPALKEFTGDPFHGEWNYNITP